MSTPKAWLRMWGLNPVSQTPYNNTIFSLMLLTNRIWGESGGKSVDQGLWRQRSKLGLPALAHEPCNSRGLSTKHRER